jgi:hypothetical protein
MTDELCMLLEHLRKRPAQPAVSFDDIRELFALLSSAKNQEMVKKQ